MVVVVVVIVRNRLIKVPEYTMQAVAEEIIIFFLCFFVVYVCIYVIQLMMVINK